MPAPDEIQYLTDEEGTPTGVIVPIDLWLEILAETGDLLEPAGPLP
jgi:hypothetical protein